MTEQVMLQFLPTFSAFRRHDAVFISPPIYRRVYAPEPVRTALRDRLSRSKARARDAWLEGQAPKHPTQFIPLTPIESVEPRLP